MQHELLPHLDCGNALFQSKGTVQPPADLQAQSAVRTGQPPVLGELTASPVNSSLKGFLFHRCGPHFSFAKTKEKWGRNAVPHSGTTRGKPANLVVPIFVFVW